MEENADLRVEVQEGFSSLKAEVAGLGSRMDRVEGTVDVLVDKVQAMEISPDGAVAASTSAAPAAAAAGPAGECNHSTTTLCVYWIFE